MHSLSLSVNEPLMDVAHVQNTSCLSRFNEKNKGSELEINKALAPLVPHCSGYSVIPIPTERTLL